MTNVAAEIDHCPTCHRPGHASETDDLGRHEFCAAVESLRAFATSRGEPAFAELCAAALASEGLARARVRLAIARISVADGSGLTCGCSDAEWDAYRLSVVRDAGIAHLGDALARSS